jgi:membrane-associated protease RseP (regulator of RpoE activity)
VLKVTLTDGKMFDYPAATIAVSNAKFGSVLLCGRTHPDGSPNVVAWFTIASVARVEAESISAAVGLTMEGGHKIVALDDSAYGPAGEVESGAKSNVAQFRQKKTRLK